MIMKYGTLLFNIRNEIANALNDVCILYFTTKTIESLKTWFVKMGLKADYLALILFLRRSYVRKQTWRQAKK